MQTKQVISEVDFDNSIEKLNQLELIDDIQYIHDELGIRALGAIYVSGNYEDSEGIRDFEESIELDVLAPYDKLHDYNEFKVKLAKYDYSLVNGNLKLIIDLDIYGIYENNDEEDVIEVNEDDEINESIQFVEKSINDSVVLPNTCGCDDITNEEYEKKHRECLEKHKAIINPMVFENQTNNDYFVQNETFDNNLELKVHNDNNQDLIVEEKIDLIDDNGIALEIDELVDTDDIFEEFDDILDDQICTVETTKYYICDSNSTYETISKKYNVDIKKLMKINNYKVIGDKCIIEIPND